MTALPLVKRESSNGSENSRPEQALLPLEILGKKNNNNENNFAIDDDVEEYVSWTYWLTLPSFYFYGLIYTAVRMMVNVQTVYFYIIFPLSNLFSL